MNDITALALTEINDALAQLKQLSEYPTPSTQYARVLRKYITSLVEALEAAEKRNAELEDSEYQLIQERDNAEQALADMYQAATGERPEWSNMFGFADAVDAVEQRLGYLESRTVTVKLPKRSVGEVMHMSGFSHDYAEGWCSGNDNAINEMKLAGIQVIEGEGQ